VSVTLCPCHLFTFKKKRGYLKAKEELWKLQIFHHAKIYPILKKKPLKETKNPSTYYGSITNLKFEHKPKISFFQIKILI
jgi:hypothetical protein